MALLPRPIVASLLVALAAGAWPGVADAQRDGRDRDDRAESRERGHGGQREQRALGDAVRRVERATRGQVLSAERVRYDGREVNRVKVIDDRGRVRVYWDDPQSSGSERPPRSRSRDGGDPNL